MMKDKIDNSRRRFFKVPFALVAGTALATYSKPSNADPIQIIVQAMSEAAKWALDTAIQQIEDMMAELWNASFQTDTTKVAKVGDGVNATKVEIHNQKILRSTMPAPRACDMELAIDNKQQSETDFKASIDETKSSFIGSILSDKRSYAAGIRDQLRLNDIEFINANSRGGLILSPNTLFGDLTRKLTIEEESTYRKTATNLVGINGNLEETLSTHEGLAGKLKRKKYTEKANSKTIAMSVFEIDIANLNSGAYTYFYQQIDETYYSDKWRLDTASVADIVPSGINLFNQSTIKLDLLNNLLKLKEQTMVLTLIRTLQELK
ncbi:hypothetical protein HNW13_018240 [Shewanella sp. BF02_Schw]|uniref:hypothetical protein n=1 Tax=Shewanella sp. BF02_Schw TaxID=394908 RepID=UPI00177CB33C|nr:hypothetical protein [Shewanella sp. BF02_Schw]MBO1897681.1 hypothetical protein [Shewanella sp. BF02_Schw]